MYSTISVNPAESTWNNALDVWQDWSDAAFSDHLRAIILNFIESLAVLVGYLVGFSYGWSILQCVKTARYGLAEAMQAAPVLRGWWSAPFVHIETTLYPEACWQAMAPATVAAILDYELAWACAAEAWE
jgi:hypothetical protein